MYVKEANTPIRLLFYDQNTKTIRSIFSFLQPKFQQYAEETHEEFNNSETLEIIAQDITNSVNVTFYELVLLLVAGFWYYFQQKNKSQDLKEEQLTLILDKINAFIAKKEYRSLYTNTSDLQKRFGEWDEWLNEETKKDIEYADRLLAIEAKLQTYKKKETSSVVFNAARLILLLKEEAILEKERGIEIFNRAIVSPLVPLIQYNDTNAKKFFKLYKGRGAFFYKPNYSFIVPSHIGAQEKENRMYLRLWMGDGDPSEQQARKLIQSSYEDALFFIEKKQIRVNTTLTKLRSDKTTANQIADALPLIQIETISEENISGDFIVYNVSIDPTVFLFMVSNDPVMQSYIYMNETEVSYADKKHLKFRFLTGITSSIASIGEEEKEEKLDVTQTTFIMKMGETDVETENVPLHSPYIQFLIHKAPSREFLSAMKKILQALLSYYEETKETVQEILESFPSFQKIKEKTSEGMEEEIEEGMEEKKKGKKETKEERLIKKLRTKAPDVFQTGYSTDCQKRKQPDIIDDDQVAEWEQQTFEYEGKQEYQTVLKFPLPSSGQIPKYNFICPSKEYPFPTLIENKRSNNAVYPMIPCCGSSKTQLVLSNIGKKSIVTEKKQTAKRTIISNKLADQDHFGPLPPLVKDLLEHLYTKESKEIEEVVEREVEEKKEWLRIGMPRHPNSLIACLLIAVGDDQYKRIKTQKARLDYLATTREEILEHIEPALLKQELFELDDQAIRDYLGDQKQFLDPKYVYRALEEFFDVNIFVFELHSKLEEDINKVRVEIPYHAFFHIRPTRHDRKSVFIYKHLGSKADVLETAAQCELVVLYDTANKRIVESMFDSGAFYRFFYELYPIYTWKAEWNDTQRKMEIIGRKNLYDELLYSSLFTLKKQFIDPYGKTYGFVATINKEEEENREFLIFVPPTQPENIPSTKQSVLKPIISAERAQELFGQASAYYNTGLWFPLLDLEFGFYIPVTRIETLDLKVGPIPYLPTTISTVRSRVERLQRNALIFLQLFEWVYSLTTGMTAETFVKNYIVVVPPTKKEEDTVNYYNFTPLRTSSQILPQRIVSPEAAIEYLGNVVPTLVHKNKIRVYSEDFQKKLILTVRSIEFSRPRKIQEMEEMQMPEEKKKIVLRNLFERAEDFLPSPVQIIFLREMDLMHYVRAHIQEEEERNGRFIFSLVYTLDLPKLRTTDVPFYFKHPQTGKIYMIQTVLGGEKGRALQVAFTWNKHSINLGYNAFPLENIEEIAYMIYAYDQELLQIYPFINKTNGKGDYLELLQIEENRYAAFLPLL